MRLAITGGTGFLGRHIVNHLAAAGHYCQCWFRPTSDAGGFEQVQDNIAWVSGDLDDESSMQALVSGVDAVVHAAFWRPGTGFRHAEGDVATFVDRNMLGTIRLIEHARRAGAGRFVFISSCSVHDIILDDRKLDEAHPLWSTSHYGAHKAAIEKFIHSFGFGEGYDICSLRPTGIYGMARPVEQSKWFDLIRAVKNGEPVRSARGGKEVHALDVARAVEILLTADGIAGQAYNCYDRYVAEQDVAEIARRLTGSTSEIEHLSKGPKHQIDTTKLRNLGMTFGGEALLLRTVEAMLRQA